MWTLAIALSVAMSGMEYKDNGFCYMEETRGIVFCDVYERGDDKFLLIRNISGEPIVLKKIENAGEPETSWKAEENVWVAPHLEQMERRRLIKHSF